MRLHWAAFSRGRSAWRPSLVPIRMAAADEFTPAQKQELGAFIRDYSSAIPKSCARRSTRSTSTTSRSPRPSGKRSCRSRRPAVLVAVPGERRQSQGNGDAGRVLRLQLPLLQGRPARHGAADEGRPQSQARPQGFPGARPGLGRGRPSGERRAQSIARRPLLAVPQQAAGMHGPIGKAEALAVAANSASTWTGSPRTWRARR